MWLLAEACGPHQIGTEVALGPSSVRVGDVALYCDVAGTVVPARRVASGEAGEFKNRRAATLMDMVGGTTPLGRKIDPPPLAVSRRPEEVGSEKVYEDGEGDERKVNEDDGRTLWIDYDSHGARHKAWKDVYSESSTILHGLEEFVGPQGTLKLVQYFLQWGGDPRLWLSQYKRSPWFAQH